MVDERLIVSQSQRVWFETIGRQHNFGAVPTAICAQRT